MGYFFSKDEASKNGDPPPLLPLPAENHQEPAVAENDESAAAAETNVSPVYGSPVLLPSMQLGLDLKLERQEEEVVCGDSQEQELQPPLLMSEQAQPPSPSPATTAEAACSCSCSCSATISSTAARTGPNAAALQSSCRSLPE